MEEIWKDISSYEGYYQVSTLGNFRSLPRQIKYKNNGTWCTESENMSHADITGLRNMFEHHHPSNSKRIKCLETGEVFSSYYRAVKWLGKTNNSISALVRGTRNCGKAFGYHWEFID